MRLSALLLLPLLLLAVPARADDSAAPVVKIETSLGTITLALDRTLAPATVDNFVAYVRAGHYDGTAIYRVEPGFVIQMGSYDADGAFRAGNAPIALETANGLSNLRGTVAMARTGDPNSATSEFFINLADNTGLDATAGAAPNTTGYAVFGTVTEGMDVVDRIAAVPLGGKGPMPGAAPLVPVVIVKVTVSGN